MTIGSDAVASTDRKRKGKGGAPASIDDVLAEAEAEAEAEREPAPPNPAVFRALVLHPFALEQYLTDFIYTKGEGDD